MQEFDWNDFYQHTRKRPPWPRLVRAVELLGGTGEALDLGCGAGRDTHYLLSRGFQVTAVDGNSTALEMLVDVPGSHLIRVQSSFEDFSFTSYDLINAHYALPFISNTRFANVFARLKASLKPGGFFVGQFFGVNDTWNTPEHSTMTFLTREQTLLLLDGLKIFELEEQDREGTTADGSLKHWHVFHIIARNAQAVV